MQPDSAGLRQIIEHGLTNQGVHGREATGPGLSNEAGGDGGVERVD